LTNQQNVGPSWQMKGGFKHMYQRMHHLDRIYKSYMESKFFGSKDACKIFFQQYVHIDIGDIHNESIWSIGAFRHLTLGEGLYLSLTLSTSIEDCT